MLKFTGLVLILLVTFQQCGPVPIGSNDDYSSTQRGDDPGSSDAEIKASTIVQRLSQKTPLNDPLMAKVVELVQVGRERDAALEVTKTDGFINNVVRDMATKMSNREQSVSGGLNDFVATFMGVARDNIDARQLLTGNFYYSAPNAPVASKVVRTHMVMTNAHYQELDAAHINLAKALVKQTGIPVIGADGTTVENLSDPAGVITSRAFMSAHASAGTNRRLVEYSMMQFMCAPIAEWSNTSLSDAYVGRDIGRTPDLLYKSKCVGCHAPMDAMRPAFAHVDFVFTNTTGFIQYMKRTTLDPRDDNGAVVNVPVPVAEQFVPSKFRRAKVVFSDGFAVESDNWENLTPDHYGWRSSTQGRGLNDFGKMISESRGFSRCMAQRAFETVCYQSVPKDRVAVLDQIGDQFEKSGYQLKSLFADVISHPDCLKGFSP